MRKITRGEWITELILLAVILAVALATPPAFGLSPINWISGLFVALFIASRIYHLISAHRVHGQPQLRH